MEFEEDNKSVTEDNISVDPSNSSVNNLILDYYKKFGRKRDLEQFFSLSTAQCEIRDPTGTFWRRMKSQNDSSDSCEKKSESSTELCRISIQCSIPEPSSSQKRSFERHSNSDSESPPIVTEELPSRESRNSDNESVKSEGVQSQRSNEATLDMSMNKPHSPTSSITSQRKLEWDSLADVGYANESDKKTSVSSLSTLERLALNQQYSHNDSKQNMKLGPPTSHSTPVEEVVTKSKGKKGLIKKSTNIYQKDVDLVELNVPHNTQSHLPQSISVNLSKHICFNVEKNGEINIDNIKKDISVSPEKIVESSVYTQERLDKEIQTSLLLHKDKSTNLKNSPVNQLLTMQRFPVLISLNTLKNRNRKRKFRAARKKLKRKNKLKVDDDVISKAKVNEHVSEAESFEYMPGHIYNQNHMKVNQSRGTNVGNKSSLESSAGLTTDSSKRSKHSFSKDLEKSIELLKAVLQQNNNDSTLKKKLIKEVVQRLIKSKYRDDESSTDFLSGLSFNSKIIGEGNHTSTSTSDTNHNKDKSKLSKPKKSILQTGKFNSNGIACTSQSAPNLPSVFNSEKTLITNLTKPVFVSNTDSETSSKDKKSPDIGTMRTSSDKLYKEYLEALKTEQAYKKHLTDKENILKQKLVSSETTISQLAQADFKTQSKLKNLMKDLIRNNYNDGSGDASKLEGQSNSNMYVGPFFNNHRNHSVFTLSSGHSDSHNKNPRLKKIFKSAINNSSKTGYSKTENHYCCCPHHDERTKVGFTDSSVQVDIKYDEPLEKIEVENELPHAIKCSKCKKESPRNIAKVVSDFETGDLKYICVCSDEGTSSKVNENFQVYKCSRLVNKSVQLGDTLNRISNIGHEQEMYRCCCDHRCKRPKAIVEQKVSSSNILQNSKSSQTNVNLNLMVKRKCSAKSIGSQFSDNGNETNIAELENDQPKLYIQEAVRCIQTDISINPRLSDPCLSDINIMDNKECVKLIKEQIKEVSKLNFGKNTDAFLCRKKIPQSSENSSIKLNSKTSSDSIDEMKNSVDYAYIAQFNKEVQSNMGLVENDPKEISRDQFIIPIQGTNMTLKVNLGTAESDDNKLYNVAMKSQGIVTEKNNVAEQFTSLREDCTKSVQCCNANIFQQLEHDSIEQNIPHRSCNQKEVPSPRIKAYAVNTCLVDKPKCNTFPKKDHAYARKPLLRTNTDISKFENLDLVPIDLQKDDNTTNKGEFSIDYDKKEITEQTTKMDNKNQSENCATCSFKNGLMDPITKSNNENSSEKYTDRSKQINQQIIPSKQQAANCTVCSKQNILKEHSTEPPDQNQAERFTDCTNQRQFIDQLSKPNNETENPINAKFQNQSNQPTSFQSLNQPDQKYLTDEPVRPSKQSESNKCATCSNNKNIPGFSTRSNNQLQSEMYLTCSSKCSKAEDATKKEEVVNRKNSKNSTGGSESHSEIDANNDPVIDMIEGITSRFSKKDVDKIKRKKCFKEIMNVLNYLLDTEDVSDDKNRKSHNGSISSGQKQDDFQEKQGTESDSCQPKTFVNKGVQSSGKKNKSHNSPNSESSEIGVTSELPTTSSDSVTCKVLNKIKKECEKYHQKRCKSHNRLKTCETSSTTSVSCEQCKRVHHCYCVKYKCKPHKIKCCGEKPKKKCVAYNLILQTSDSVVSEETVAGNNRPLRSIIVKVPSKRKQAENVPFKEMTVNLERNLPNCSPRSPCRGHRSKSLPNESEMSSTDDFLRKAQMYTVREYLERNRPDFIEKSSKRQDCLKTINETRPERCSSPCFKMVVVHTPKCVAGSCMDSCNMCYGGMAMPCNQCVDPNMHLQNEVTRIDIDLIVEEDWASERNAKRNLLSLQLANQKTLNTLTDEELRHFAKQLSEELRRKKLAPKFISEREMKKHSEKIYKSLPEVTRKKEELKKENIKKTNLLMANIFKKNLQKKTLRGSVNLSNYSTVIKI